MIAKQMQMAEPELIWEVRARFHRSAGQDAPGPNDTEVRLMDRDPGRDDVLGEAVPDAEGRVSFRFSAKDFSPDLFRERFPDLYLQVRSGEDVLYTSPVMEDTDIMQTGSFDIHEGAVLDMGVFLLA